MPSKHTPNLSSTRNALPHEKSHLAPMNVDLGKGELPNIETKNNSMNAVRGQGGRGELEKVHSSTNAIPGHNYLATIDGLQKSIDAASGNNVLAEIEKQRKAMDAMLAATALVEVERAKAIEAAAGIARGIPSPHGTLPPLGRQPLSRPPVPGRTKGDPDVLSSVADLGALVRKKRKEMGLTQQKFADLTGVGRRFILELEGGKPTLELGRVLKVCQSIGIDLAAVHR